MKPNVVLAAAIAASLGDPTADAATIGMSLQSVKQFGYGTSVSTNISSSTATWSYDDDTRVLTQTGGVFNLRLARSPQVTYFRHTITGLVIGGNTAAAAEATSFVCTEGNFGEALAVSQCGNYTFGPNFINESTATWGPGTQVSRVMGGDDTISYVQQSISYYNGMLPAYWDGTTLILSNAGSPFAPGPYFEWTLQAYPVPIAAAAWLFGGALGLLGTIRRRERQ